MGRMTNRSAAPLSDKEGGREEREREREEDTESWLKVKSRLTYQGRYMFLLICPDPPAADVV